MSTTNYPRHSPMPLRDRIAIEIWHRFADSHVEDWEDEPHQQEFYFFADAIIRRTWEALRSPTSQMVDAAYDQQAIVPEESWTAMIDCALQPKHPMDDAMRRTQEIMVRNTPAVTSNGDVS